MRYFVFWSLSTCVATLMMHYYKSPINFVCSALHVALTEYLVQMMKMTKETSFEYIAVLWNIYCNSCIY